MKLFNKEIKFNKRIKPKEIIKPVLKELPKEDVNPESVDTEKKVGLMTKLDQIGRASCRERVYHPV